MMIATYHASLHRLLLSRHGEYLLVEVVAQRFRELGLLLIGEQTLIAQQAHRDVVLAEERAQNVLLFQ